MNRYEYLQGFGIDKGSALDRHRAYYAQMVTPAALRVVGDAISECAMREIRESADPNLNNISLRYWDWLASMIRSIVEPKMRELGDIWSPAGGVCVVKEAARQLKEAAK